MSENPRKAAKIRKIRAAGLEPLIQYWQTGMEEDAAYQLEELLIARFGRAKIDTDGILTNLLADARPPSALGRSPSEETRKILSERQLGDLNHRFGKRWTEEQNQSRSAWNKANGIKPPVRSGPMSDEQKAAIGNGNRGKKRSEEVCAKLSQQRKGRSHKPPTEETKRKISEAQKGVPRRKMTPEEKIAHSERVKLAWARRKGL
jgi:hypothetical protein